MLTTNPFIEISAVIPPAAMKIFVFVMIACVAGGTIFDVIHKKSARYFFENMKKSKANAIRSIGGGEKVKIACVTAAHDVLASGEFCNARRRAAHLLTMYGFIAFMAATAIMVARFSASASLTPPILPLIWHLGAAMVCAGGCWFWFFIRADVAAEGQSPFRLIPADLFVVSLVGCTTFALLWSLFQSAGATIAAWLFFVLFVASAIVLFAGVPWSKFAHMFFKPAAAYEKRVSEAEGSRNNLPEPADQPAQYGLGIKRSVPRNY